MRSRLNRAVRQKLFVAGSVAACLVALAGCGGVGDPKIDPGPDITPTTTPFSGGVLKGGQISFPFTVTLPTTNAQLTLTSLSPASATSIGIALGVYSAGKCTPSTKQDQTKVNDQITVAVSYGGTYCVLVYDAGTVTDRVDFVGKVVHY